MENGGNLSGNRLLLVLLFLVSLVSVVAIIVAAVSLTNSDGDTPSISVNSGAGTSGSSGGGGAPIVINSGAPGSTSGARIWRIAIGHDFGAHEYLDEKGYITGFSKDFIYAVCEYGGMNCRLIWDDYTNCFKSEAGKHGQGGQGLFNGWYDACSSWYPTVTRVQVFDFSLSFMKLDPSPNSYFVKESTTPFDPMDLTDKTIGFLDGWATDAKCLARQDGVTGNVLSPNQIVYYGDSDSALEGLMNGQVDAILALKIHVDYKDVQGLNEISTDLQCELQGLAMMTTKDNPFNSYWNAAFQKYRDSGKFSQLCKEAAEKHKDKGDILPCVDAP